MMNDEYYYTADSLKTLFETIPAACSFWNKLDSFIWYEWPYIHHNSLFKSVTNWHNSWIELIPRT